MYRLECRADGDLRFSVAHVADEEAIHGPNGLHIGLYFRCGLALIRRVLEEECRFELTLPRGIGDMWRSRRHLPTRVQIEKLDRHLVDRRAGLLSLLTPPLAAQLVQSWRRRFFTDVAR